MNISIPLLLIICAFIIYVFLCIVRCWLAEVRSMEAKLKSERGFIEELQGKNEVLTAYKFELQKRIDSAATHLINAAEKHSKDPAALARDFEIVQVVAPETFPPTAEGFSYFIGQVRRNPVLQAPSNQERCER